MRIRIIPPDASVVCRENSVYGGANQRFYGEIRLDCEIGAFSHHSLRPRICHSLLVEGRKQIVEIVNVVVESHSQLFEIVGAGDGSRLVAGLAQRGQKHAGKDGDDGNYHEELYKREHAAGV